MMDIRIDDLKGTQIAALLREHLEEMHVYSPAASVHALDLEALRAPAITFWSAWEGSELMGCGALKELDPMHAEIKSMRTAKEHLRKGVAVALVRHLLQEARQRKYLRVSLETGAMDAFEPARALYRGFGFQPCPPYGDYIADLNSLCMTLEL